MLGPRREQEEMESLAFGRRQERGNSVAQACLVLSTPCCSWTGQKPKAHLKIIFAFRVSPVASDLHLLLAAWDFQHSVWGLVIAFFPNASLQISKEHCAGSMAGSETRARMTHPSSLHCPMTHLHGGDGAEVEMIQVLGPCSITMSSESCSLGGVICVLEMVTFWEFLGLLCRCPRCDQGG